jgi:hypothetical protein
MVSVLVIRSNDWTQWIKDKIKHRITVQSPTMSTANLTSETSLHGELKQYPTHCTIIQNHVKKSTVSRHKWALLDELLAPIQF